MAGVLTPEECKRLSLEQTLELRASEVNPSFPCLDCYFKDFISKKESAQGPMLMLKDTYVPLQAIARFVQQHPELNNELPAKESVQAAAERWRGIHRGQFACAVIYVLHFPHILEEERKRRLTGLEKMVMCGEARRGELTGQSAS